MRRHGQREALQGREKLRIVEVLKLEGVGQDDFGCPSNDPKWKVLGAVSASGTMRWVQKEINIRPREDIYAIAVGPSCLPLSGIDDYYFEQVSEDDQAVVGRAMNDVVEGLRRR